MKKQKIIAMILVFLTVVTVAGIVMQMYQL